MPNSYSLRISSNSSTFVLQSNEFLRSGSMPVQEYPFVEGVGFIVHDASGEGEVQGARSPVRFQHADKLDLVVRCPAALADEDPDTVYHLRVLDAKKRARKWLFASGEGVGGVHVSVESRSESILPVKWSKYGDSSLIMNTGSLPAGEYAVGKVQPGGIITVFCFGVD